MSKITLSLLKKIFPGTPNAKLDRFVAPFNQILPKYGINDKNRFAAFIGNVGIESDRLKALEEYASGAAYEGRTGLGNVRKGDGIRFKGRSVLQTTGRFNYWLVVVSYLRVLTGKDWDSKLAHTNFDAYLKTKEYSDLLKEADKYNVNFLENPELLETFPHAVEAAGVFIKDNNLNKHADKGEDGFYAYAGVLNRGSARKKALHYDQRKAIYDLAMRVIPDNFKLNGSADLVEKTGSSEPTEDGSVVVDSAESVVINESGDGSQNGVKVEVADGNVSVETTTGTPAPKEKVAVVATKPPGFFSRLYLKIAAAVTGNSFVQWLFDQLEKVQALSLSQKAWLTITGFILLGSMAWIVWEAIKNYQERNRQKELDRLLVQENSTDDNFVQLIPADEVELYRARKYKIITRGESVPQPPEI